MFILYPDGTTGPIHSKGARDETMRYMVIGRIKPTLRDHAGSLHSGWGIYGAQATAQAAERKIKKLTADRPDQEFRIVPIQHGFNPYET